jgi:phosphoribosylaminoimidazole-succinocarboxamide synthase
MSDQKTLRELLNHTLETTDIPGLPEPIRGKVRDIYDLGDKLLLVTTDRISAFDVVLGTVPCKGQVLNAIAVHWFERTSDLVPNHLVEVPDPVAMVVKKLAPLPVEVVVRRYLTGSLWREYETGIRRIYGQELPDGMQRDQQFENPLLTPTTKAELGKHDEPLSPSEIVSQGLVEAGLWGQVEKAAFSLFARGEQEARKRGLILVDTKYEFGLDGEKLVVMDEIHTPDSSRYWEEKEYETRFDQGKPQKMLDKENIRQWLLDRGFSGQGPAPDLTDEVRVSLARTYLDLQHRLTGTEPELPVGRPAERLAKNLQSLGLID